MALTIRNTDNFRIPLDHFKRNNGIATDTKAIELIIKMYQTSCTVRDELIKRLERSEALNAEYRRRFEELEITLRRSLEAATQSDMVLEIAKEDYQQDLETPFRNRFIE